MLGGSSPHALAPLLALPRSGFETTIPVSTTPRYLAVQALNAQGQVLGTSASIRS
jgi:hypothetical protein